MNWHTLEKLQAADCKPDLVVGMKSHGLKYRARAIRNDHFQRGQTGDGPVEVLGSTTS